MTINEEGAHLHLGKSPPHPVSVDHGDARQGCSDHRLNAVGAANFGRNQGLDWLSHFSFERFQC